MDFKSFTESIQDMIKEFLPSDFKDATVELVQHKKLNEQYGKQFFLLEHTEYRDKVPAVVLDAYGKIMADNVKNGFDDAVKQQIRDQIRPQEQTKLTPQKQQLQRLEIWQKYYQNGEWLRQAESGGEANYDMVDGRVNNLPKQPEKTKAKKRKKKESVIGKLHKKQIEIAIRSGKPIPKYLEQNRELNKR